MAFSARNSSLSQQPSTIYRFAGSGRTQRSDSSSIVTEPTALRTTVDDDSRSSSDELNEKTGFSTPYADSETTLAHSYPARNQRPLIYGARNQWQVGSTQGTGEDDDDFCPEGWMELLRSRAFKRWMMLYLFIMTGGLIWYFKYYMPEHRKAVASTFLSDSLKGRFLDDSEYGYFGSNRRVQFAGMQQLRALDRDLVPGSERPGVQGRRLVIVGDIHGCVDELQALLYKVSFSPITDHIITTGDMISKGPSSPEVIDLLISHNASCVRGNHEDKILHAYRDHHAPTHQKFLPSAQQNKASSQTQQQPISIKRGRKSDLLLASSLTKPQISYLNSCPLILTLGPIPSMGSNVSIVHAGLVPGVALEKQDPSAIMTMRSIDLRNQVPSSHRAPDPSSRPPSRNGPRRRKYAYSHWDDQGRLAVLPWAQVWDTFQSLIPSLLVEGEERARNPSSRKADKNGRPVKSGNPFKGLKPMSVVYGHDSKAGVVQGDWHTGLDGGCVDGGHLAALVISEHDGGAAAGVRVERKIVSVQCQNYRGGGGKEKEGV